MPPLVRTSLTRIRYPQLVCHIYPQHEGSVLVVDGGCRHRFSNCTISSWHISPRLAWKFDWQCMCGKKKDGPLVFPQHTCNATRFMHFPCQCTLRRTVEVPCILEFLRNSNTIGPYRPHSVRSICRQVLQKPYTCGVVVHDQAMSLPMIAIHQFHHNAMY
jgi:hypothetical protein